MNSTLYYVHDPMCSWCWAYRPAWSALCDQLPGSIQVRYLLGGLAADCEQVMSLQMQQTIRSIWLRIERQLGTSFNHDFWRDCQPRRSTYPACRAVIAAQLQGESIKMIEAIQRAYYLNANNPSDVDVLVGLAKVLCLNVEKFFADLNASSTQAELERQILFSRQLPINGFPSLVLEAPAEQYHSIQLDYSSPNVSLADIDRQLSID